MNNYAQCPCDKEIKPAPIVTDSLWSWSHGQISRLKAHNIHSFMWRIYSLIWKPNGQFISLHMTCMTHCYGGNGPEITVRLVINSMIVRIIPSNYCTNKLKSLLDLSFCQNKNQVFEFNQVSSLWPHNHIFGKCLTSVTMTISIWFKGKIFIYANNWFPDRDAIIVIIVIFQTNTPITSYWLAQLIL